MPRKKMTPAERKAWGEKMRLAREAKASPNAQPQVTPEDSAPAQISEELETSDSAPEVNTQGEDTVTQLLKRIEELEKRQFFQQPVPPVAPGAQVTSGGIVGTVTKYSINPKDYPDPRDRLFEEKRLQLKGFNRDWWDLEWIVGRVNYETKDRVNTVEPKFQLRLIRIIEDPETGEPSNKRYTLWKGTFFEDPQAAIQVALDHGFEVSEQMEKAFLDEMRYLRMRDWLLEAFYPPKPSQQKINKTETVIGNRLVEVYEINSQESATIPFQNISKKL
jgi:hypothetical protein